MVPSANTCQSLVFNSGSFSASWALGVLRPSATESHALNSIVGAAGVPPAVVTGLGARVVGSRCMAITSVLLAAGAAAAGADPSPLVPFGAFGALDAQEASTTVQVRKREIHSFPNMDTSSRVRPRT